MLRERNSGIVGAQTNVPLPAYAIINHRNPLHPTASRPNTHRKDAPMSITNVTLETERLTLRAWRETDLAALFEYASVPGVGEMAGWRHHASMEDSRQILQTFIAGNEDGDEVLALVHKEDNRVIGSVGLHRSWAAEDNDYAHLSTREIGYVLSRAYWGRGLTPEAVRAVIAFCFVGPGLDALTCSHFVTNHQSRRVIEKCGFSLVKPLRYYARQLDQTFDGMAYILYKPSL